MNVVGIVGSIRKGSYTKMAVNLALQASKEAGAKTKLIDLQDYELIFCDGKEDETNYPQDVFKLRLDVREAHGIILGTPEYHGSFSGILKNTLDLMGFDEFEGKMVGVVSISGGVMGGLEAASSLRNICRALHSWVIPEQAVIPEAWRAFQDNGKLIDPELEKRVRKVGQQVTRFATLHASENALEFLKSWQCLGENPGATKKEAVNPIV
ncbi:MAG: NAD(P)H-dependent oxidoreductase [Thaumarchaeota archaeon]|nr:NAD(P)H-dependent oxidoreductase [Nitrososphaerota archaeon]